MNVQEVMVTFVTFVTSKRTQIYPQLEEISKLTDRRMGVGRIRDKIWSLRILKGGVEMFNDIIPRSNCIRGETVHMTKRITSYFMKIVVIGTTV